MRPMTEGRGDATGASPPAAQGRPESPTKHTSEWKAKRPLGMPSPTTPSGPSTYALAGEAPYYPTLGLAAEALFFTYT